MNLATGFVAPVYRYRHPMRKRYVIASWVSSAAYVVVGPLLTILSLTAQTDAANPEEDFFPIGAAAGWILVAVPLTLIIATAALIGEAFARKVHRSGGKLLVVALVSAVLVFGTTTLLGALVRLPLQEWAFMSLTLLPGWLVAAVGPRFWWWIAELDSRLAQLDAEPEPAQG
ncbi:hypothetical protein [Promicromonospora kroppenstedtii]|uniref:hypothetical protein n=1 Tax=Promicromonospora kroppenstedtii TaxID=440482 RepID=UPI0004ACCD90|nr:hypothetical protein [Promicromonospora kroppenstedtii]